MRVNFDVGTEEDDESYVLCKRCKYPMVELARYDVMNEIPGSEAPGVREYVWGGEEWIVLRWLGIVFVSAWWWVKLRIKGWRLNRVLRQHPRTLICGNCGALWKR